MPTYVSKILENYILIEFQENEDKTLARVLDTDDYWRKINENCWKAPYSMKRAEFAKDFCGDPQKYLEYRCSSELLKLNRQKELYNVLNEQEIEYFVHFTNAQNLENIFKYGLLSVRELQNRGIEFVPNDMERFDNKLGGISLSVSFPNYRMFYKYQCARKCDWVILLIDPRPILELKCNFCTKNAASIRMRKRISLNPVFDFKNMFCENSLTKSREKSGIPKKFTTDPQAEILVMEDIPLSAIQGICFRDKEAFEKYNYLLRGHGIKICIDETYFGKRMDYMYWGN